MLNKDNKKDIQYKPRISDKLLDFKLKSMGAVSIIGAKWCGKTTSAKQFAKSVMEFGNGTDRDQNIKFATINTKSALEGETPRLFDEWQEVPALWDAVRYEVDQRHEVGQFILTGSTVPTPKNRGSEQKQPHHTGTGRFALLKMRPMSLFESGESNGKISLGELFSSPEGISATSERTLEEIAYLTCRGGWPAATYLEGDYSLALAKEYVDVVVHQDISRVDDIDKNPDTAFRLMRSYARHQATQASLEEISQDVNLNVKTTRVYLNALSDIYALEEAPAWNPNIRSKTAIRTSSTRYFSDPSLATTALGVGPGGLLADLNTFGFIFETLVVRDLRIYAEPLDGTVYHYRDKNGLECDTVISLRDGRYGLAEIKLGQDDDTMAEAANRLTTLERTIDSDKMGKPSFMAIITANGTVAYRRPEDGIYIVPIACLKD